jgi:hypothetical protein
MSHPTGWLREQFRGLKPRNREDFAVSKDSMQARAGGGAVVDTAAVEGSCRTTFAQP